MKGSDDGNQARISSASPLGLRQVGKTEPRLVAACGRWLPGAVATCEYNNLTSGDEETLHLRGWPAVLQHLAWQRPAGAVSVTAEEEGFEKVA